MSRRMGYLSPDFDEDMMEEARRSGRTGRFVRSRYDDDEERMERRRSYRMARRRGYGDMDDERMGGRDYEYRRRGYRSEMRDDSDSRRGSDRDGYD